ALLQEQAARAQAEAVLRGRDEFLAVAAHELRTPITSLQLYAQYLARQLNDAVPVDPEHLARGMRIISEQSGKLARLISQLLDVSRIEAGQLQLTRQSTDVVDMVARVVERTRLEADDRPITLQVPAPCTAAVDELRLEQVVMNLLDN